MARRRRAEITVRRLHASDIRAMVALWKESDISHRPAGRDRLGALQLQRRLSPDLFLGAFVGDELVGSVIASDDRRRGWINRLAVRPSHRREGVAKALIAAAEEALRKRGRHLFCIHVESDNKPSMRLFEEEGYIKQHDILYYAKRERKSY